VITKGLTSSETDLWSTPQWLFDKLALEFDFTLDVCATHENSKCERYFTKDVNGLSVPWSGVCWMNPPYGREIGKWVNKAVCDVMYGHGDTMVVCLLPARTDTNWWHDNIPSASEVRFIRGRLKFGESKNCAPFPSCIVIFEYNAWLLGCQKVKWVDYGA